MDNAGVQLHIYGLASKYFGKFSVCAPGDIAGEVLCGKRSDQVPFPPRRRLRDPLLHQEVSDRRRAELGRGRVAVAGQPPRQGPGPHLRGLAHLGELAGVGGALLPAAPGHQVGGSRRFEEKSHDFFLRGSCRGDCASPWALRLAGTRTPACGRPTWA